MRRLSASLCALSLVTCIATAAAWARSYWARDQFGLRTLRTDETSYDTYFHGLIWSRGDLAIAINNHLHIANRGRLHGRPQWQEGTHFHHMTLAPDDLRESHYIYSTLAWKGRSRYWHGFAIEFSSFTRNGITFENKEVEVPIWCLMCLTAIYPILWTIRYLHRKERSRGCAVCGYDLSASPERCPECGTLTQASAETPTK